ncbi:unnamed protein product [Strongylus vulgaris]|uniref:Uncharacterized protein n=1 Tax=Strongylus vulgaris TaxID=40348 RepID=A0A3P7IFB9_STRVU|nr:unnamed protein product [Strongylus vulgaris]
MNLTFQVNLLWNCSVVTFSIAHALYLGFSNVHHVRYVDKKSLHRSFRTRLLGLLLSRS